MSGKRPRHIVNFGSRKWRATRIMREHFCAPTELAKLAGKHEAKQVRIKNKFRDIEHAKLILKDLDKLKRPSAIFDALKKLHPEELRLLERYSQQSNITNEIHKTILEFAKPYFDTIDMT